MSSKYVLKTKPTDKNPLEIIADIPHEKRQIEAIQLLHLFERAVNKPAVVWGEKFIGFGTFKYQTASGYNGEIYETGFSVTKRNITLHLYFDEPELQKYLLKLGKIKSSLSCIYINKLEDVNVVVLEEMVRKASLYTANLSNRMK